MTDALPMTVPGIVCCALFGFTLTWNEFIYALTFVSQSANKTAIVGVTADLIRGDIYYWGSLMAGAVLASVPIVALYVLLPRLLRLRPHRGRRQELAHRTDRPPGLGLPRREGAPQLRPVAPSCAGGRVLRYSAWWRLRSSIELWRAAS